MNGAWLHRRGHFIADRALAFAHRPASCAAHQEFRDSVILAYECGYREDDVLLKLTEACDQSASHLKPHLVAACVEATCIIWMTLDSARPSTRWSTSAPVSSKTSKTWTGFVSLIVDGYFEKRWAAYPLERLQVELAAMGRIERPDLIAEKSRFVYETLNFVSPQFPTY